MVERVRLVIWDLDETFWKGTLTEGGQTYRQETHDIVIELARRGIMSSICSKNDLQTVEPILRGAGIWDYFIFPSINWNPKGPRIREMIEAIGLRPATVVLIDDNPMNLNEALHFVADMQVAPETFIPEILGSPLFVGKNDADLTRLAQYKVLERRRTDEIAAGDDNTDFLRGSNLRVRIDHDIEGNIDRVIELINRTNQLNFTKRRLSENPETARAEVITLFSGFMIQGGLVHVQDSYGDYGLCGFYAVNAVAHEMVHFCFSCRILNMGVEQWLYDKLARPRINVVGEVLTDLIASTRRVDWINTESVGAETPGSEAAHQFDTVMLRGGCELQAIAHYLGLAARNVVGDYFVIRHGLPIRMDHSVFINHIFDETGSAEIAALAPLGYTPEDFRSKLTTESQKADFFVFSFWQNASNALYRHRTLGVEIPFTIPNTDNAGSAFDLSSSVLDKELSEPFAREAVEYLRQNFDRVGVASAEALQNDVSRLMRALMKNKPVFILLQKEKFLSQKTGKMEAFPHHIWANDALRAICGKWSNLFLIQFEDYITSESDVIDGLHFKRQVYHRISNGILRKAAEFLSQPAPTCQNSDHRIVAVA
jgi:FkbH-like protein